MLATWRAARDIVAIAKDIQHIYTMAMNAYTRVQSTEKEIELSETWREAPLEHEEPVWYTECEYEHDTWHLVAIEPVASHSNPEAFAKLASAVLQSVK